MFKKTKIYILSVVALCSATVVFSASTNKISDATDLTEITGSPSYTYGPNGFITIEFNQQPSGAFPSYVAATVIADSHYDDIFIGNYNAAKVKGVSFKLRCDITVSLTPNVMVVLKGNSGRQWHYNNVLVPSEEGEWIKNDITLTRTNGWIWEGSNDGVVLDNAWQEDLGNVKYIGIRFAQNGFSTQKYTVAEFVLAGEGFTSDAARLTPVESALLDKYGVSSAAQLTSIQKLRDVDFDGLTDYEELLAENDESFANSIFLADIVDVDKTGITIRFACVKGAKYTVLRSDSLWDPFQALPDGTGLQAIDTGFMNYKDTSATGDGPFFYKIRRDNDIY